MNCRARPSSAVEPPAFSFLAFQSAVLNQSSSVVTGSNVDSCGAKCHCRLSVFRRRLKTELFSRGAFKLHSFAIDTFPSFLALIFSFGFVHGCMLVASTAKGISCRAGELAVCVKSSLEYALFQLAFNIQKPFIILFRFYVTYDYCVSLDVLRF